MTCSSGNPGGTVAGTEGTGAAVSGNGGGVSDFSVVSDCCSSGTAGGWVTGVDGGNGCVSTSGATVSLLVSSDLDWLISPIFFSSTVETGGIKVLDLEAEVLPPNSIDASSACLFAEGISSSLSSSPESDQSSSSPPLPIWEALCAFNFSASITVLLDDPLACNFENGLEFEGFTSFFSGVSVGCGTTGFASCFSLTTAANGLLLWAVVKPVVGTGASSACLAFETGVAVA